METLTIDKGGVQEGATESLPINRSTAEPRRANLAQVFFLKCPKRKRMTGRVDFRAPTNDEREFLQDLDC
jgi:hypothetical protein